MPRFAAACRRSIDQVSTGVPPGRRGAQSPDVGDPAPPIRGGFPAEPAGTWPSPLAEVAWRIEALRPKSRPGVAPPPQIRTCWVHATGSARRWAREGSRRPTPPSGPAWERHRTAGSANLPRWPFLPRLEGRRARGWFPTDRHSLAVPAGKPGQGRPPAAGQPAAQRGQSQPRQRPTRRQSRPCTPRSGGPTATVHGCRKGGRGGLKGRFRTARQGGGPAPGGKPAGRTGPAGAG